MNVISPGTGRRLLPSPKPLLMGPILYENQKLMLSTCAQRRGEGKWSRRTLAMKELPKDAGALGGCMLLTLSIVFSLGDGIQERRKCVLVAQLCPTLCSTMDCSLPSSSVHGILQTRTLEWVAVPFSRGSFLTQGSNPDFPHCREILYHKSHQGSPKCIWSFPAP